MYWHRRAIGQRDVDKWEGLDAHIAASWIYEFGPRAAHLQLILMAEISRTSSQSVPTLSRAVFRDSILPTLGSA
jgi:hypothetical protein